MNITKTESGKWKIREMKHGRTYSKTVDHRPTQREAREIMDEMQNQEPILQKKVTIAEAWEAFRSAKGKVLSPSTLKGYRTCFNALPAWFREIPITEIRRQQLQKLINDYSGNHSPKSCRNLCGFVSALMSFYEIKTPSVKLPQPRQAPVYIPSKEDVSRLLKAVHGSKYEVAIRLGAYGLRRSEIMALTLDDLSEDNVLTINKALVESEHGSVLKGTKTTKSARAIVLTPDLGDLIRQQGFIYDGSASRLTMALTAFEDIAGIPHFPLHKLRHFFASYLHDLGFSEAQIKEAGGWADASHVMRQVYTHAMQMEQAKVDIAQKIGEL